MLQRVAGMDIEYLKILLPILSTAVLAIGGWLFVHWQGERARRYERQAEAAARGNQARVDHLNSQIKHLYGPLYAHLITGEAAWASFRAEYAPVDGERGYFDYTPVTPQHIARWQVWMRHVFHPTNQAMVALILNNTHLLEGDEFPPALSKLISHVKFYDGIIAQWDDRELSLSLMAPQDYVSIIDFPQQELADYIVPAYRALLEKRRGLLCDGDGGAV